MNQRKCNSTEIKIALEQMNEQYGRWFGTEVRTGGQYYHGNDDLLIFDALMVEKSYTGPSITGYEIKVSRSDFLADNKWHLYLKYCNKFYFVCPTGMIKKEELPEDVGLYYYDPESCKINPRPKKKASFREINDPLRMYQYIVYSQLEQERIPFYSSKKEYAKAYLADKAERYKIGRELGTKMAKEIAKIEEQLEKAEDYEKSAAADRKVQRFLSDRGVWIGMYKKTPEEYADETLKALTEIAQGKIDERLKSSLRCISREMEVIKKYL